MKNQIFISYRVKESLETARQICDYLTSIKYVVFFDEKSARSGRFDIAIENAVRECKDFVLILTPTLFAEEKDVDWVQKEIRLALKYGKNIVVVTTDDIDHFPNNLPESIKKIKKRPIIK